MRARPQGCRRFDLRFLVEPKARTCNEQWNFGTGVRGRSTAKAAVSRTVSYTEEMIAMAEPAAFSAIGSCRGAIIR